MELRILTPADLEACAEVFYTAEDELTNRRGLPPVPRNEAALLRLFEHVSASSPDRSWVAAEGERMLGFGMAAERGPLTFLSFLFVHPEVQGRGFGRALLERSMLPSTSRATCIEAIQPVSAALYARLGMAPRTPIYTLIGRAAHRLPALAADIEVGAFDQGTADSLDRDVLGFERTVDHRAWQGWERRPFTFRRGGAAIGYGYAHVSGRLGPVVAREAELVLPIASSLMRAIEPADEWQVQVPGPAAAAMVGLLEAGFRLDGPPALYCATTSQIDHGRYLPASLALP